jgi:hypothetical protein
VAEYLGAETIVTEEDVADAGYQNPLRDGASVTSAAYACSDAYLGSSGR